MIKWFIFKLYSNTIMKKGLIFILCRNMIMEKGFKFKWDSGRKSCLVPHLAQPTSLNITRYNHFSTTLSTFSFVDITRQSYFLQLLWISESYFSTTSQEFPNFSISHPKTSQFFSVYVQFSFKLLHLSAFQVKFNHGKNIDFIGQQNSLYCLCNGTTL